MAALATIPDLEAITGQEIAAGADTERAVRLLEMAGAAIERWCNRTFAFVADDEITVNVTDGTLVLPNGPVTEITSITGPTVWGVPGSLVDPAGYQELYGRVIRRYGWWGCGSYVIVYSHGYTPIPDDIVGVNAQMVADILQGPEGPVRAEAIGEASRSYIDGRGSLSVPAHLKADLRPYRVAPSSIELVR